jgi:hypothetical protein
MTAKTWTLATIGLIALAGLAAPVAAGATGYTSSADFDAATTGLSVENFGSYTAGTLISDGGALGVLTYSFDTASGLGGVVTNLYNSFTGNSLAAKQSDGPLNSEDFFYTDESFTVFFPTAVTAVGIFSNTNLPVTMTLTTASGSTVNDLDVYDTATFGFIGFTSKTAFTSATFSSSTFNIPEIEYGSLAGGVPEPAAWALMLVGFAGLGAALRGRRGSLRTAPTPA